GGAAFVPASVDVVTSSSPEPWIFSGENEVYFVGTSAGSNAVTETTAEIIAFLPNVKRSVCEKINGELGIGAVPTESGDIDVATNMGTGSTGAWVEGLANGPGGTIGEGAADSLNGQAFGCFQQPATTYYYYHVLIEQ